VPFVRRGFRELYLDQVFTLGLANANAFVSEVQAWKDLGWALDDDISRLAMSDSPLSAKEYFRRKKTMGFFYLPPPGWVGHQNGEG